MSGISRRIDQLGRIVLPIEVRKKLKLKEGSLLDIVIENENLILSKNEPLKDFKNYIVDVCENVEDCIFLVLSDESVIFASKPHKDFENQKILPTFLDCLKEQKKDEEKSNFKITEGFEICEKFAYYFPLTTFGDNHGYACFFFNEKATKEEMGMMNFVAKYIASKL